MAPNYHAPLTDWLPQRAFHAGRLGDSGTVTKSGTLLNRDVTPPASLAGLHVQEERRTKLCPRYCQSKQSHLQPINYASTTYPNTISRSCDRYPCVQRPWFRHALQRTLAPVQARTRRLWLARRGRSMQRHRGQSTTQKQRRSRPQLKSPFPVSRTRTRTRMRLRTVR